MFRKVHRSARLFLAIISASIIAIIVTFTPTSVAQNSVPPTAVQAAKMPQFASRLAHPAKRLLPPKAQPPQREKPRRGPLDSTTIYENGPANGNTDAWTINYGFVTSDSFNVAANSTTVTGMTFTAWLFPGDTLTSVEISVSSSENGGTSYFDQTVNFTQGSCTGNQYGYNICTETASFTGLTLNAGTYWVNLQNASVPSSDPVYWDENSGAGCDSPGCPSLASENSVGSVPSEAFTILGDATTTTSTSSNFSCAFEYELHDLHNFGSNAGPSGLAIDTAGKLYGTLANGGSNGAGLLYGFAERAGHWVLTSLYSFLGGSNGNSPSGVIVGPEGKLYGAASGGLQACGNDGASYCGLIYEASPSATPCLTAMCSWNETTIYRFAGNTDTWGGSVSASDSAGDLYGISYYGGAYEHGGVFELSPSSGGWTQKILYSFTGGNDGAGPTSLLLGHHGNLYGTTQGGGLGSGTIFQLAPSGGDWTENVLFAFTGGTSDGYSPHGLVQDGLGNLYGISICSGSDSNPCDEYSRYADVDFIFELSPHGGGWGFGVIDDAFQSCLSYGYDAFGALAIDAGGNLYAVYDGEHYFCTGQWCEFVCGGITKVPHYPLISSSADIFWNLTSDANGNLYGTTNACGSFETPFKEGGMIWQYSQ